MICTWNDVKYLLLWKFWIYNVYRRILGRVLVGNIVNIRNECLIFLDSWGMNRSAEQTNRTRTASRFTRFVCPALRFIRHEPRKKDTHSLKDTSERVSEFLQLFWKIAPISVAPFTTHVGMRRTYSHLKLLGPKEGQIWKKKYAIINQWYTLLYFKHHILDMSIYMIELSIIMAYLWIVYRPCVLRNCKSRTHYDNSI